MYAILVHTILPADIDGDNAAQIKHFSLRFALQSNASSAPGVRDFLGANEPDRRGSVMSDYVPSHSGPPS